MKRVAKQQFVILMTFGIIFALLLIGNNNFIPTLGNNMNNSVHGDNNYFDKVNPKLAKLSAPIHIDGVLGWANAKVAGICKGSGNSTDPYIIEDLVIDGGGSSSPILIENSNIFFEIINCTVYNCYGEFPHKGGITLNNVSNGLVINNNCFNNWRGIYLHFSHNNTIRENIANNNLDKGIAAWRSDNNVFSRNNMRFNSEYGLYLTNDCDNNSISFNTLTDNLYGIYIYYYCNSNIIWGNSANNNRIGIFLQICDNSAVRGNIIKYNARYGICLYTSNFNSITGNLIMGNSICIKETECEGNNFEDNNCVILVPFELLIMILIIIGLVIVNLTTILLIRLKKKIVD